MDIFGTLLLQGVTQLINIGCTTILFYHEDFKTELLLNYRKTLGTLYSTSVGPVYQSLNDVLPELFSQLINLHSGVNGHQKTSMDFCVLTFAKSMIILLL